MAKCMDDPWESLVDRLWPAEDALPLVRMEFLERLLARIRAEAAEDLAQIAEPLDHLLARDVVGELRRLRWSRPPFDCPEAGSPEDQAGREDLGHDRRDAWYRWRHQMDEVEGCLTRLRRSLPATSAVT